MKPANVSTSVDCRRPLPLCRRVCDGSLPSEPRLAFEPAADRLYQQLSDMIVAGALQPGAKISEPDLATRFGTSRAPVREAMRRLQERKLVTRIARQGARVTILSPERIAEIYLVREVLEGAAARQAARRITDAQIGQLRDLLDVHEARVVSSDTYLQGGDDDDFHFRIIRASGNETLSALLLDEYYLLIRMLRGHLQPHGGTARRALTEHRRIADALADRDGELAEMLMRRHVAAAHARICQNLPQPLRKSRKNSELISP
jgi:DNA-binding GntR family transcriptional regulator